jgi:hypothetical protein
MPDTKETIEDRLLDGILQQAILAPSLDSATGFKEKNVK